MRSTTRSSAAALRALRGRRTGPGQASLAPRSGGPETLDAAIALIQPLSETLVEGVCVLDRAGYLRYINPAFQRLLRRSLAESLGKRVEDLCVSPLQDGAGRAKPDTSPAALLHLNECMMGGRACSGIELLWRAGDGSLVPTRCSLAPLWPGRVVGASLTLEPIVAKGVVAPGQTDSLADGEAWRRLRVIEAVSNLALSGLSSEHLLERLLDTIRTEMRLENVAVLLTDGEADEAIVAAASGPGSEVAPTVRIPLGDSVLGEVVGSCRLVHLPNPDTIQDIAKHLTPDLRARMDVQSLVFAPLVVDERSIGALYLGADTPDRFSDEDLRVATLMGECAASALERGRAADTERRALAEAEEARERLRVLISASGAIGASLDYIATSDRLADCVIPTLADACAVYLLDDDGSLRKVTSRPPAPDPTRPDQLTKALASRIAALDATIETSLGDHSNSANVIARCVNEGAIQTEGITLDASGGLMLSVVDGSVGKSARTAKAAARAEAASGTVRISGISVPLLVREHPLGALYLACALPSGFSAADISLIEELAERAAIAIDNARLYTETEQARAAGSATARQLDTIFNATDVGIFVTDVEGEFLRINPYGLRMFGLSESDFERSRAEGTPWRSVFELRTLTGDPLPPDSEPLYLARVEDRVIEMRLVIHRIDTGKDIQALVRCRPWHDPPGHVAGAIGVITDITAISQLERQKDEFIGIASHELKTPLTSLKILAELLSRRLANEGDVREQEQAQRMQVAIMRMEKLIHDLLDVSRIQEGKLTFNVTTMDLVEVCLDAVHEQELLSNRAIRFVGPRGERLPVYGDQIRIQQVVTNLLSNALKYSRETAPVTVRVRVAGNERIVSVEDHGPGVPAEEAWRLFDRFSRVPGMQVQSGSGVGLGLGLYICREIVERHGGRIWFESKLGHGSVFSFALPAPVQGRQP